MYKQQAPCTYVYIHTYTHMCILCVCLYIFDNLGTHMYKHNSPPVDTKTLFSAKKKSRGQKQQPRELIVRSKNFFLKMALSKPRGHLKTRKYVCCSVLQCVAVCCSVLRCVAVCSAVLQNIVCVAECCSVLQCAEVFYSVWHCVLQCTAVYYYVWQYVALCRSMLQRVAQCCSAKVKSSHL